MTISELTKEQFCQLGNLAQDKDHELIKFAYENLNNLPFDSPDENYERMISGIPYCAYQKKLETVRMSIRDTLLDYGQFRMRNYSSPKDFNDAKLEYLRKLLGHIGENGFMEYPIYFDYGFNTYIGDNFYANYNLTILDVSVVRIGNNVMCATGVSILTATHPNDPTLRGNFVENAFPITIEDNVWLGSNSTVLPGVTIGANSVIAAGSVVNKSVPPNSVVAGVPAKVIKTLNPKEKNFDIEKELEKRGFGYIR
jgi:acetyltransferase-like isoleucine patch superfamily enzyme